jgi:hypothetical protein
VRQPADPREQDDAPQLATPCLLAINVSAKNTQSRGRMRVRPSGGNGQPDRSTAPREGRGSRSGAGFAGSRHCAGWWRSAGTRRATRETMSRIDASLISRGEVSGQVVLHAQHVRGARRHPLPSQAPCCPSADPRGACPAPLWLR